MTLTELPPTIQILSRADKLQLIQLLAADVACNEEGAARNEEEEMLSQLEGKTFEVWSPYDSYGAAAVLEQALQQDQQNKDAQ